MVFIGFGERVLRGDVASRDLIWKDDLSRCSNLDIQPFKTIFMSDPLVHLPTRVRVCVCFCEVYCLGIKRTLVFVWVQYYNCPRTLFK